MCGILGYYAFGERRPNVGTIADLFILSESRGKDATGLAYLNTKDKLQVMKYAEPATEFIKRLCVFNTIDSNKIGWMPKIMIGHTRAVTQGLATDRKNNHPIYNKKGIAIVHNGIMDNDSVLFTKHNLKRDGEVDSEIILAMIAREREKNETFVDKIKQFSGEGSGWYAVACISEEFPTKLHLFRNHSSLYFGYNEREDIMYFASEESILEEAIVDYNRGFVLKNSLSIEKMDDLTGMVIDNHGVDEIFKIEDCQDYTAYYNRNYPLYDDDVVYSEEYYNSFRKVDEAWKKTEKDEDKILDDSDTVFGSEDISKFPDFDGRDDLSITCPNCGICYIESYLNEIDFKCNCGMDLEAYSIGLLDNFKLTIPA